MKNAQTQTVESYREVLGLGERAKEWDWFLNLNTELARRELGDKLKECDISKAAHETFLYVLRKLWYDFDSSLPRTDELRAIRDRRRENEINQEKVPLLEEEWGLIKEAIRMRTASVCDLLADGGVDFSLQGDAFLQSFLRHFILSLPSAGVTLDPTDIRAEFERLLSASKEPRTVLRGRKINAP